MLTSRQVVDEWWDILPGEGGMRLHLRRWEGEKRPYVLLHGLASNNRTWDRVASQLAGAGHAVIAVDQRGHGLSDKPTAGYDFATITGDLVRLLDRLGVEQPYLAGQSWGGNVVLEFAARHPQRVRRLIFVDGGFLDFTMWPDPTWAGLEQQLRPPALTGMASSALKARIRAMHADWDEEGIEATLANFQVLDDGSVRPWLSLDRHMAIVRALWEQRPSVLYGQVASPVLIAVAEDPVDSAWMAIKHRQVAAAEAGLACAKVHWFADTAHDIHVHRPAALAALMLAWREEEEV